MAKIKVLGVGNLLLTDEGAGIHAVEKIRELVESRQVEVIDGGTLGLDLLSVFEEADKVIIIDCARGGDVPGSIYRFGIDNLKRTTRDLKLSMHDFNLVDVINLAEALGKKLPEIIFYGIEPASLDWGTELTPEVKEAVNEVVKLVVKELVDELGEDILKKGDD